VDEIRRLLNVRGAPDPCGCARRATKLLASPMEAPYLLSLLEGLSVLPEARLTPAHDGTQRLVVGGVEPELMA
jgi:hypothetical protein